MSEVFDFITQIKSEVTMDVIVHKQSYLTVEHVLNAMFLREEFCKLVSDCGGDIAKIADDTGNFLASLERIDFNSSFLPTKEYTDFIIRLESALSKNQGNEIKTVLAEILACGEDCYASYFLRKHGVNTEVLQKMRKTESSVVMQGLAIDLTVKARNGEIGKLIGREKELSRIIQILFKKRSCNPVLVAHPGVGKTAIVEGLANAIAKGNVPKELADCQIWSLNMGSLVAGTSYRGEFEERLQNLIEKIIDKKNVILFIDEIHTIVGAGRGSSETMDASNLLKPYLSSGELRCIGATTYDEYKNHILKDKALARRFKKVDVAEPSANDTYKILLGIKEEYASFHKVEFTDEIIRYIVDSSQRFITNQYFPDKAIEVMDEIGSLYHSGNHTGKSVTVKDVDDIISQIANVPSVNKKDESLSRLRNLSANIKVNLFGQDKIVDDVTKHIFVAKAGLANKNRPLGVFALTGSTGTGKTELVKQLATNLNVPLLRFDMSEYNEKNSTAKLIGAAPGYVGFEQGGSLTEAVSQNPESVILFDEIEKAHPEIYNLLLQVMDDGRLTDNSNKMVNFKNTIIFMTSNVGSRASENAKMSLGFCPSEKTEENSEAELKNAFPPEFRNRFTAVYKFDKMHRETLIAVINKEIRKLNESLAERNVQINLDNLATDFFATKALDENMGARPVERLVRQHIAEQLAEQILFADIKNCRFLYTIKGNEIIAENVCSTKKTFCRN